MMEKLYLKYKECGCRIATDSRAITGGEMFFALKGESFDGNDYALRAVESGAVCAVVNRGTKAAESGDARMIVVEDTLKTLRNLARYHRRNCLGEGKHLPVLGLTGTNGKTTTKELIREVLATAFNVTATRGNLNNDIGVPLSLLSIAPDTQIAVIEMGANHPDDINHLVEVAEPDFGLITNVGKAHLLGFGSFEGVKKAKGQMYDFVNAHGGEIFVNVDDPVLLGMAQERGGASILPYGPIYDRATVLPTSPDKPFLNLRVGRRVVHTHLVGAYNAANVLAAIAVGRRFGVDVKDAVAAIESYVPSNNRSQMTRTERNTLIVDAYNANPSSMNAALDNFELMESSRKIALLGDMRELGEDSLKEHEAIVKKASKASYEVIFVGEEFRKALEASGMKFYRWFPDSTALATFLEAESISGAAILIKGSRGIQMEKVFPVL